MYEMYVLDEYTLYGLIVNKIPLNWINLLFIFFSEIILLKSVHYIIVFWMKISMFQTFSLIQIYASFLTIIVIHVVVFTGFSLLISFFNLVWQIFAKCMHVRLSIINYY